MLCGTLTVVMLIGDKRIMNWEAIGALGEVLGAITVIGSLLFVGYQLRQASNIERAKAQRDLLLQAGDWISIPSLSKERFNAIRACLSDFDGSDPWSQEQFHSWATNVLLLFESVLYNYEEKFVHPGSFERFEQLVLAIVKTPGGRQWWDLMYNVIGTDVGEHIAARIVAVGESTTRWDDLLPQFRAE